MSEISEFKHPTDPAAVRGYSKNDPRHEANQTANLLCISHISEIQPVSAEA